MDQFTNNQLIALAFLLIWTLPWKGVALWKAATRKEKIWFIIMLVVNTAGILEILYVFIFSNDEVMSKTKRGLGLGKDGTTKKEG